MDLPTLASISAAGIVLISAAVSDVRTREVSDAHWWILVAVPFVIGMLFRGWEVSAASAASILLFAAVFTSRKIYAGVLMAAGAVLWFMALFSGSPTEYLLIPVYLGLFLAAYITGLVRGGADTKCLMAVAVSFPVYATGDPGIIGVILPPAVSVLFTASVSTFVFGGVWLLWRNRGGRLSDIPRIRMGVDEARRSFVWPVEDVRQGRVIRTKAPDYDEVEHVYSRLEGAGVETVLVEPMLPFIVPLAVSFAIVMAVGCPFALIL